jgi:hypothetical protein
MSFNNAKRVCPVGAELIHVENQDGWKDGWTGMAKLIGTFRDYVNSLKYF